MKIYYGWIIVAVACVCYGFGISPAYYSWGIYISEYQDQIGFTKADLGGVFGLFTFLYSGISLLGGIIQTRIGIRTTMVLGSLMAAIGFFIVSQAETKTAFYIGFSVFGGCGIGLSTILPCQTLGQNWFLKRRALAIALIVSSGGAVGPIITRLDGYIIRNASNGFSTGWIVIGCISIAVAILAALMVKDHPEQMGLHRDGAAAAPLDLNGNGGDSELQWTATQAMLSKQFLLIVMSGIAYATPWGVVISHGPSHLKASGFDLEAVVWLMGFVGLFSIGGRLAGMIGDWIAPQIVLAVSLVLEGIGVAGFYFANDKNSALLCLLFVGAGFGAAYVSIPVVFSHFFGRKAFGTTAGARMLITGIFNGLGPWVSGMIYDRTESYFIPFMTLAVLCFVGAFSAAIARHPGDSPAARAKAESA